MNLQIVPILFSEANEFVRRFHRHHKPMLSCRFSIAVADDSETIRGVILSGRPVSRILDDGWTLEVNRCCTDGTPNAPSMLYSAAWRAAKSLGYKRLITYTLDSEGGASLRGAGWKLLGQRGGGSWSRTNRPRVDLHPTQTKILWEA